MTENAPRLTDINLIFSQRVYLKQTYDDSQVNPKEWISYWNYMLIWKDDFSLIRRSRTLIWYESGPVDSQKIVNISAQQKADKVIFLPEAETRNKKVQDKINEFNSKAEEQLKRKKN